MTKVYQIESPTVPKEPGLKGKDLGLTLDIGGNTTIKDLTPAEQLSKQVGGAYNKTESSGINVDTKLPIISDVVDFVGDSPVGWGIGKLFEAINLPSYVVQNLYARLRMGMFDQRDLPQEVKDMLAQGKSMDEVADYMVHSNKAFTNDAAQNLVFSLLLDPLNFTPLVFSKMSALKPLGSVLGGIAGGAAGGALVAGPVGMLGGAAAGAFSGYKAMKGLGKGAEMALEAANAAGDTLGAGQKLILALNKERGLDITAKTAKGSAMLSAIDRSRKAISGFEKEIEAIKAGKAEGGVARIQDLNLKIMQHSDQIRGLESAQKTGMITNHLMVGAYRSIVGAKNTASAGLRTFAAATLIPVHQAMAYAHGGKLMNATIDSTAPLFGDKADQVVELIGEGLAQPAIIGVSKSLIGPEESLAKMFATNTADLYYEAHATLDAAKASGDIVVKDVDNLAAEVLRLAEERGGAVRILDTKDPTKIKQRIEILRSTPDIERIAAGRASNESIQRLESSIADDYSQAKIESMVRAGGVEKVLAETMQKMGVKKVMAGGVSEIERMQTELLPEISDVSKARELFRQYMTSIGAAVGKNFNTVAGRASLDAQFDHLMGGLYNELGKFKDAKSAKQASQIMGIFKSSGFASANRSAALINKSVRRLRGIRTSTVPEDIAHREKLVRDLGEDGFDQLVRYAESLGDIQVVKKGNMFHTSALAATRTFAYADKLANDARDFDRGAAVPLEQRAELGKSLVDKYVGTVEDVRKMKLYIQKLRQDARKIGDQVSVDFLTACLNKMRGSKTLSEARQAWADATIDHFDDVRANFQSGSIPERINEMLLKAIDNRSTMHPITDIELRKLKVLTAASGIDAQLLDAFTSMKYRIVRAPIRGSIRSTRITQNPDALDTARKMGVDTQLSPFVDLSNPSLANITVDRYTASRAQELMSSMFAPIGNAQVTNSVRRRMTEYLSRGGITTSQIERIMDELVSKAMENGVGARGLDNKVMEEAFRSAIELTTGTGGYDRFKEAWKLGTLNAKSDFRAIDAVMYAFRGDLGTVGATQYFTGGLKIRAPWMSQFTDKWYPQYRFKMNPMYWVQEYIESPFLNAARGVDKARLSTIAKNGQVISANAGEVRNLAQVGRQTQTIVDNVNFASVYREDAVKRALVGDWTEPPIGLKELFKRGAKQEAGEALADTKEFYNDALAMDIASKNFADTLMKDDPSLYAALVTHYGTNDARELFVNFINHRKKLGSYQRVMSDIEASRPAAFGWMTIPDNAVGARSRVLSEELDRVFGSFGGLGTGTLAVWRSNPQELADTLSVMKNNLADAGYDITMFDRELHALQQESRVLASIKREAPAQYARMVSGGVESPELARFQDRIRELRSAFDKVIERKMKATYKYSAAKYILMETGFREGAGLSYEGDRIAQALALGHSYGAEIGDVASRLETMVDDVAREFPDAYKKIPTEAADDFSTQVVTPDEAAAVARRGVSPRYNRQFEEAIRQRALKEIDTDPTLVDAFDNASYRLITDHGAEEKVFRAFQTSYATALDEANKVTYFDPNRSFFERTINHPFLGFYPYSYMFKKILPETMRFLFKRPFGMAAPGAGYQAYMHVRDYVEQQIETDYYFRKTLEDNNEVAFLIGQLFPGVPWDITAVPGPQFRAIARSMSGGDKNYDLLNDLIGRDIISKSSTYGSFQAAQNVMGAGSQLMKELTGGNKPKPAIAPDSRMPGLDIGG